MKKVNVFSKKLGSNMTIVLDGNGPSITDLYENDTVNNRDCSLSTEFSNRDWAAWTDAGWNNWGAICN
jgi:hypothetical protein